MNKEKLELRRKAREEQKELARIESEKNQRPVDSITISIEWKKSYMWGNNPSCEAEVRFKESDGMNGTYERSPIFKCSGCGYDKESTVIADVFNRYLKYKLWNKTISELKKSPYGCNYPTNSEYNHRYYAGGIGTNCYKAISEFIGGKWEHVSSGKTFDVYKYTDLT